MGKIISVNVKPMRLQLFDIFFMENYLQTVLISDTNKNSKYEKLAYGDIDKIIICSGRDGLDKAPLFSLWW